MLSAFVSRPESSELREGAFMRVIRRAVIAVLAASGLSLSLASLAQAACPTANPAANIPGFMEGITFKPGEEPAEYSDQRSKPTSPKLERPKDATSRSSCPRASMG